MRFIILFSLLIFTSQLSFSCNCFELGKMDESEYKKYNLILRGVIFKVDSNDFFNNKVYVLVKKLYKGAVTDTIEIITPRDQVGCGIDFLIGLEYLIYTYDNNYTNSCTRTTEINIDSSVKERLYNDIKFLESKMITKH